VINSETSKVEMYFKDEAKVQYFTGQHLSQAQYLIHL